MKMWRKLVGVFKVIILTVGAWVIVATLRSIFKISSWYHYPFFFAWAAILASIIVFTGLFTKIFAGWSYTKLFVGWIIAYLVLILVWCIDNLIWG